jgi:hypothetical protein
MHPAGAEKTTALAATVATALAQKLKQALKAGPVLKSGVHSGEAFGISVEMGAEQFPKRLAVGADGALFISQALGAVQAAGRDDFGQGGLLRHGVTPFAMDRFYVNQVERFTVHG